ncbi:hypothetical protein [Bradyrhizobium cytisi]|uniref:Uncharacterized protein n=1 Tax=Bradyrhizobium cytisi TaxID=515489 RepID=A0A5S4WAG0_9BRAD|nr:hypothetical protein [Bradyrhizobium cytisi]TYL77767.1 hypothetical protein FXB38_29265 [Bradyrhizobium cytisi]
MTTAAYREKLEHSALRAVFLLDDYVTGDDSSNERFSGQASQRGKPGLHTSTTDLPREGCGIAAALFRWAWCDPAKHSMVPQSLWL